MSLRFPIRNAILLACASVSLGFGAACGGGGGSSPTPTTASVSPSPASGVPSPQRPALASPVASPSAVAISTATAVADASSGETYEIQSGDTLLTVAEQVYGDATQWRKIYDANKDVIGPDPDKLKVGMKLKVPPKQ